MPEPDLVGLWSWLLRHGVGPEGEVFAWVNTAHPGYRYPEAAALLVRLLKGHPEHDPLRAKVTGWLVQQVSPEGAVARDTTRYVFDSALALGALIEAPGDTVSPALLERMFEFVAGELAMRRATPEPGADVAHWSTGYSCHLLKLVIPLLSWWDKSGDGRARELAIQLERELGVPEESGRFLVNRHSNSSYLHAHCYAMEGLSYLQARAPEAERERRLLLAGEWLATVQTPAGGLRAFHDGRVATGPQRADAIAQALRLWVCLDAGRFQGPIDRAREHLASLQTAGGGLRYEPGSDDINVWCAVFAIQAEQFVRFGAKPRDLL